MTELLEQQHLRTIVAGRSPSPVALRRWIKTTAPRKTTWRASSFVVWFWVPHMNGNDAAAQPPIAMMDSGVAVLSPHFLNWKCTAGAILVRRGVRRTKFNSHASTRTGLV